MNNVQVKVREDSKVYTLNDEHKNFTETSEVVKKDTVLEGTPKAINGLRRGKDFVYRVFMTDDNKFIHLNKVDKVDPSMKNVEISIGADQGQSSKKVDISPLVDAENKGNIFRNVVIGAIAGFAVAKLMNKPPMIFVGAGVVVGVIIAKKKM